jgi:hypothetical protein
LRVQKFKLYFGSMKGYVPKDPPNKHHWEHYYQLNRNGWKLECPSRWLKFCLIGWVPRTQGLCFTFRRKRRISWSCFKEKLPTSHSILFLSWASPWLVFAVFLIGSLALTVVHYIILSVYISTGSFPIVYIKMLCFRLVIC